MRWVVLRINIKINDVWAAAAAAFVLALKDQEKGSFAVAKQFLLDQLSAIRILSNEGTDTLSGVTDVGRIKHCNSKGQHNVILEEGGEPDQCSDIHSAAGLGVNHQQLVRGIIARLSLIQSYALAQRLLQRCHIVEAALLLLRVVHNIDR